MDPSGREVALFERAFFKEQRRFHTDILRIFIVRWIALFHSEVALSQREVSFSIGSVLVSQRDVARSQRYHKEGPFSSQTELIKEKWAPFQNEVARSHREIS